MELFVPALPPIDPAHFRSTRQRHPRKLQFLHTAIEVPENEDDYDNNKIIAAAAHIIAADLGVRVAEIARRVQKVVIEERESRVATDPGRCFGRLVSPRVPPIVPLFTHSPVRLRHGRRLGLLVILAHEGSAKSSAEFAIERLTGPGTSDGAPTWLALEP